MRKKILVLTQKVDQHIEPVAQEIRRRDRQMVRFDFGDFPQHVQLAASLGPQGWDGILHHEHEKHALNEIQSIWWRRPTVPQAPLGYDLPTRAFLNLENLRGFIGVLQQGGWHEHLRRNEYSAATIFFFIHSLSTLFPLFLYRKIPPDCSKQQSSRKAPCSS